MKHPEFEFPEVVTFDGGGVVPPRKSIYPKLVDDTRKKLAKDCDPERVQRIEEALVSIPEVHGDERALAFQTVMRYLIRGD